MLPVAPITSDQLKHCPEMQSMVELRRLIDELLLRIAVLEAKTQHLPAERHHSGL